VPDQSINWREENILGIVSTGLKFLDVKIVGLCTRMLNTFLREFITQSKTAFSFGTRLMVFKGRSTRRTRKDFIVPRFSPPELPLKKFRQKKRVFNVFWLTPIWMPNFFKDWVQEPILAWLWHYLYLILNDKGLEPTPLPTYKGFRICHYQKFFNELIFWCSVPS
jgi:hypothetical protein